MVNALKENALAEPSHLSAPPFLEGPDLGHGKAVGLKEGVERLKHVGGFADYFAAIPRAGELPRFFGDLLRVASANSASPRTRVTGTSPLARILPGIPSRTSLGTKAIPASCGVYPKALYARCRASSTAPLPSQSRGRCPVSARTHAPRRPLPRRTPSRRRPGRHPRSRTCRKSSALSPARRRGG